jgi:DNA replication protein DnaC
MNLVEVDAALRKLRLSGMAAVLEARLRQAQAERLAPLDLVATLVSDELQRRQDRLLARRHAQARFRDADRSLDTFDFAFNKKLGGTRKDLLADLTTVSLLIIDDLGMRKLPHTAAEDLLELIMRRYERASTILTSNRPVDDWGKLLGDTAAVTALLDRLLHHGHVLKCGPRSWRTKLQTDLRTEAAAK